MELVDENMIVFYLDSAYAVTLGARLLELDEGFVIC